MFQAAAAQHAGGPATMADPGAVGQAGTDAAQPAEVIQTRGDPSTRQLDGGSGILPDKALQKTTKGLNICFSIFIYIICILDRQPLCYINKCITGFKRWLFTCDCTVVKYCQ